MAELLLKDLDTLEDTYNSGAVLSVVGGELDTDEEFKIEISDLVDAQQRRNPFLLELNRVELVAYTGADAANRADPDNPNPLGFKTDAIRHSFNDGYESISFQIYIESSKQRYSIMIPIGTWNDSSEADPVGKMRQYHDFAVWKVSETAFRVDGSQSNTTYLRAVYGHRYMPAITTPYA